jgi:hypothetical protein
MKEMFRRKVFWMILVTLLLAVFIYPPFSFKELRTGAVGLREWQLIFLPPEYKEIEMRMLLAEAIIAFLLTIGICLIPFRKIGFLFKRISLNLKMVLSKRAFWFIFIPICVGIWIYPPFIKEGVYEFEKYRVKKEGEINRTPVIDRKWGFIFRPPFSQIPQKGLVKKTKTLSELIMMIERTREIFERIPLTSIQRLRESYPEYEGLTSHELIENIHEKDFYDISLNEFGNRLNSNIEQVLSEIRNIRKMKMDFWLLAVEFALGFCLSTIITVIFIKPNKGR